MVTDMGLVASDLIPARIPVLVVDDDPAVLQVTRLVLSRYQYQGSPLELVEASSAEQARDILQQRSDFAAALIDVVMESDDAGLRLVEDIRQQLHNIRLRIILRTGQPGYAPERRVVHDYDINDYLNKSDATQARLVVSVTTAIRGYFDVLRAELLARKVQSSEQASFAKTQFLAHMSHEIRTPLNGIAGIVSLLSDTALNDEQKALLEDLRLASDALLGVVNDVLDVAKIEAGKLDIHEAPFQPAELIHKVCAVFSATFRIKHIAFELVADLPDGCFIGDAQRIQQILLNYLSNAQKFTAEGGRITLRCHLRPDDSGGWQLFAEVEDNGRGIAADRLASIFEAYEQESSGTSIQYGGTGLGLSLSRSLAQLMGGQVGADSQQGRGSRFWLTVPLVAGGAVEVCSVQGGCRNLSGVVVALAEDDMTSLKVLTRLLTSCGAEVVAFPDGQALLDSAPQADAVLLDFHMPLLDGPACAAELRRRGFGGAIFALTGTVDKEEQQACLAAGMDGIISKPVDRQQLVARLAAAINK